MGYLLWVFQRILTESLCHNILTHWGRVTHICISKLTIIGSDNGLSPGRRQAIICTYAGILLIRPLGKNFNEILIEIHTFSFKEIHFKCRLENGVHFGPECVNSKALSGLRLLTFITKKDNYWQPKKYPQEFTRPELTSLRNHDDVMTWKHIQHHWPFVWGIHQLQIDSLHQGPQWFLWHFNKWGLAGISSIQTSVWQKYIMV